MNNGIQDFKQQKYYCLIAIAFLCLWSFLFLVQDISTMMKNNRSLDFVTIFIMTCLYDFYVMLDLLFILPMLLACALLKHRFGILNKKLRDDYSRTTDSSIEKVFSKDSKAHLELIMEQFDILTDALECVNSAFTFKVFFLN